ncbi:MAG TPA: formate/nitrite transporter family protein [Terriglobales bacterium]|nr:formate/nitrite transporter family protein [Terriglobales bacterium]
MDYVTPTEIINDSLQAARKKASLSVRDMLLRGMLAGSFLGYATSLVFVVNTQGTPPVVGAILFPVGFVMLVLLGLELATGNFALLPMGALAGEVRWRDLLRNWTWVYIGNLIGSVLYAALFFLAITSFRTNDGGAVAALVKQVALKKTIGYMSIGGSGWATAIVKAILCNWMVTIGTVLALVSRSTIGKIVAMWLPIFLFFALGFEHSIVNMFVIPAGMMMGAPITMRQWWFWNQIPVTLGNALAGFLFTGVALYVTHGAKAASASAPVPTAAEKNQLELEPALSRSAEMAS